MAFYEHLWKKEKNCDSVSFLSSVHCLAFIVSVCIAVHVAEGERCIVDRYLLDLKGGLKITGLKHEVYFRSDLVRLTAYLRHC